MAAPKRTAFQKAADLERTASLYLRGWSQARIAEEIGVSQRQISYDLDQIRQHWLETTTFNLDEHKAKELARLDELEREFWSAWESSKEERTKARQETGGTKDKDGRPLVTKASMEKEQRDGNPAFLNGVLSCIDRRCKLLGLDAPVKKDVELSGEVKQTTSIDMSRLSLEELIHLRSLAAKVASDEATES